MVDCKSVFVKISFILFFLLANAGVSVAQGQYVFNGFDDIQFVSKGWYQDKNDTLTCVSAVKLRKLDSLATRIELAFEILDNWIFVDSSKYELVLDDSKEHVMTVNDRPLKALKYISVNNEMAIYVEYPNVVNIKNSSSQGPVQWQMTFLTVEFPSHLTRFSSIFEKYFYR